MSLEGSDNSSRERCQLINELHLLASNDTENPENISNLHRENLSIGDQVDIASRTTPGINKPGGAARIRSINSDGTYSVTYILGGKEDHIDIKFITKREDYDGRPQRKRTVVAPSEIIKEPSIVFQKKPRCVLSKLPTNVPYDKHETQRSFRNNNPTIITTSLQSSTCSNSSIISDENEIESQDADDSLSLDSFSSPPSLQEQSNIKNTIHSETTKTIIKDLLSAVRQCNITEDGGYFVCDIEKYFQQHLGNDISTALEEALTHFELENIIMIMSDESSPPQRLLFII